MTIKSGESNIDSNVILCIYGDKDATKNLPLRTTKNGTKAIFNTNSELEFNLKDINIGNVNEFLTYF